MASGLDIEGAYDDILGTFRAAWLANSPAGNSNYGSTAPEVEWPGRQVPNPPLANGNKPWARISVKHHGRDQSGLGGEAGTIFTAEGTVKVQIFVPAGKQGLVNAARLGKVALDAFEGQRTSEVWFREAKYAEVGVDGNWFQVNVTARFTYDVVK